MMKKYPKSITAPYAVMQMLFWSALCMGQTYAIPCLLYTSDAADEL